jgi:hypothetical protein
MFARKIRVEVIQPDDSQACPLAWLDSFCMRSFTGREAFDEVLPIADGLLEMGFRVNANAFQADLEDWLTRKFGEGQPLKLRLAEIPQHHAGQKAATSA